MNFDLDDLRAFVAVAQTSSFGAAARQIHLSQPALSRRVKKLEDALGAPLFERTTRRVALTAVGRDFLPKARRVLDDLDESLLGIRELAAHRTGMVTLACVPTATYYFLPRVIRRFNARYPQVRIRMYDLSAGAALESVKNGESDFGINFLGAQEPELDFAPLLRDPFVLACRRDHPLARRKEVRWEQLEPFRLITVGAQSGNRTLLDAGLANADVRPRWFYEVQHLSTSLGLVEAGLGVSVLPSLAVPPRRHPHPILCSRPLVDPLIGRTIGILRRRGATLSPSAERFHSLLLETWPGAR